MSRSDGSEERAHSITYPDPFRSLAEGAAAAERMFATRLFLKTENISSSTIRPNMRFQCLIQAQGRQSGPLKGNIDE